MAANDVTVQSANPKNANQDNEDVDHVYRCYLRASTLAGATPEQIVRSEPGLHG